MGLFGDSVWVFDQGAYRVTYLSLDGTLLGTSAPPVDIGRPDPDAPSPARPSVPLRDGTWIGRSPAWSQAIAEGSLTEAPVVHLGAEGEALDTIWVHPYRAHDVLALLRDGGGTFGAQPFSDAAIGQQGPDGVFTVLDRRVADDPTESTFRLTRIDAAGDTIARTEVPYVPVPLDPAQADSAAEAQAASMATFMRRFQPDLSEAALAADIREALYVPAHLPWIRSLFSTQDGEVWVQRQDPTPAGVEWWRFGADLAPLGRVIVPAGLRLLAVEDGTVWGVEQDDFDVDYITRYRIVETGTPGG
jgi:hypothetical protein